MNNFFFFFVIIGERSKELGEYSLAGSVSVRLMAIYIMMRGNFVSIVSSKIAGFAF